jgi:hypothetical protein
MNEFQSTVLMCAAAILILSMTFLGIVMYSSQSTNVFPPRALPCPDYWTMNASNVCVNTTTTNTWSNPNPTAAPFGTDSATSRKTIDPNSAAWATMYPGTSAFCAKQNWALANDVAWDGITNSNSC